mgnify:CR=1 FL=1
MRHTFFHNIAGKFLNSILALLPTANVREFEELNMENSNTSSSLDCVPMGLNFFPSSIRELFSFEQHIGVFLSTIDLLFLMFSIAGCELEKQVFRR